MRCEVVDLTCVDGVGHIFTDLGCWELIGLYPDRIRIKHSIEVS